MATRHSRMSHNDEDDDDYFIIIIIDSWWKKEYYMGTLNRSGPTKPDTNGRPTYITIEILQLACVGKTVAKETRS